MRFYITITFILIASCLFGQGLMNKGASIVVKNDVHVVINGTNGHYLNKLNGTLNGKNGGFVHVRGNWINNGTNAAYGNNDGTVILDGAVQRIMGSSPTKFNSLVLSGTGDKWLDLTTTVGGGYAGAKSGKLDLGTKHLHMESKKLVINNSSVTAISSTTGLLIGETNAVLGYSTVQWNIRNSATGNKYIIPFGSFDLLALPFVININAPGTQVVDSGFINITTYPTNPSITPNNRPLPTGVLNLNNQYFIENDIKTTDRFYVVQANGYSSQPSASLNLPYLDREWDGSNSSANTIVESDLQPAKYTLSSNAWDFSLSGATNMAGNFTSTPTITDFSGVWVLQNKPPCPKANFSSINACLIEGIASLDSSKIATGTIDSSVWISGTTTTFNTDSIHTFFPNYGNYAIKRKVRSDRGCWDSISKTVLVYPMPQSSFTHKDTCNNELTTFVSTSNTATGNPISQQWFIDGSSFFTKTAHHTFGSPGVKPIQLISRNTWNCEDTLIQNITITPLPVVNFTFEDLCEGELIQFMNATTTSGTLTENRWSINNNLSSFSHDYKQVFNKRGSYDIKLRSKNSFGCHDSLTQMVVVKARAKANFSIFPDEIFIHEPYANFVERTSFANSWEWELGEMGATEFGPEIFHTYRDTGVFSVRLIAGNDQNCPDTLYKYVRVKPYLKIYIPNAFSPGNPDDVNSTFGPAGMLYGLKSMSMDIYNRWGEQLYFSEDINKPWDGTYLGKPVKEGTYLYLIKMKDIYNQVSWHQGTVTVVR